jgi:hypothetical protein
MKATVCTEQVAPCVLGSTEAVSPSPKDDDVQEADKHDLRRDVEVADEVADEVAAAGGAAT